MTPDSIEVVKEYERGTYDTGETFYRPVWTIITSFFGDESTKHYRLDPPGLKHEEHKLEELVARTISHGSIDLSKWEFVGEDFHSHVPAYALDPHNPAYN